MKFIVNTTISPHFCALFDTKNVLIDFSIWENNRQDSEKVFEFFKKNIPVDTKISFIGGVSGPGGFSSLRVASSVLTACAIKHNLPIHSVSAEKWLSHIVQMPFFMPSFGNNVWLVEKKEKKIFSLLEVIDENIETKFLSEKQQKKISNQALEPYFFSEKEAFILLQILEQTTPRNKFTPSYSVPAIS